MIRTTTKGLTTGAVALSLLLAGSAALAGQGFRGGREGAPGKGLRAALAMLELSDAQKEKVKELLEGERAKYEALRQEGRSAREALRTAAKAATPDPAAVGTAFLRVDAHRKAMRAERESSRQKLESLLTAGQRAKLEGWRGAHSQMRRAALDPRRGDLEGRWPRPPLD
jgi:Spy/CpxP family protein refolding chaperone